MKRIILIVGLATTLLFTGYLLYSCSIKPLISGTISSSKTITKEEFKLMFKEHHYNFFDYLGSDGDYDYIMNSRATLLPYWKYYKIKKYELIFNFPRFEIGKDQESILLSRAIFFDAEQSSP